MGALALADRDRSRDTSWILDGLGITIVGAIGADYAADADADAEKIVGDVER